MRFYNKVQHYIAQEFLFLDLGSPSVFVCIYFGLAVADCRFWYTERARFMATRAAAVIVWKESPLQKFTSASFQ
jgi:hypothetical protein